MAEPWVKPVWPGVDDTWWFETVGTATAMSGEMLTVVVRFRGEQSFTERGAVTPDARGAFAWRIWAG